jgi:hypothetical protein
MSIYTVNIMEENNVPLANFGFCFQQVADPEDGRCENRTRTKLSFSAETAVRRILHRFSARVADLESY